MLMVEYAASHVESSFAVDASEEHVLHGRWYRPSSDRFDFFADAYFYLFKY